MHRRIRIYILAFIVFLTGFAIDGNAQFKEEAFQQTYNEKGDSTAVADTADKLFSFKEWGRGLAHKQKIEVGTMFMGSVFAPGTAQIYNKDYWKLPIVYGGIGSLAGTGGYYLHRYNKSGNLSDKQTGTWLLAGAGLVYWGSLMDGVISYESDIEPLPGRATLYSALLPGMGQIYNGELFKLPIYWGGLLISSHLLVKYNTNYKRFKRIHNQATSTDPEVSGNVPISGETAKWYRDVYRRYRDYSIVATVLVYVLQIIDANVFAYMHDFEVTDDISMNIEPALISPYNEYAMHTGPISPMNNAVGMRVGIRF
ncbi:MAG: hypothetical protein IJ023_09740 [Bacteroidales bacterium]|mgnify:CR=1 FL=1|nr:hypothetical protein [Bacteroidales bacterium]